MIMRWCCLQTNEHDLQAIMYPTICQNHRLNISNGNKVPVFPGYICHRWQNITTISDTQSRKNRTTMGKVYASDLMMIIRWSWKCVLHLIIIIKPEVWTINHCLGLGHETMVCAVCLTMFLWVMNIFFQSPELEWTNSTNATLYMQKGNQKN